MISEIDIIIRILVATLLGAVIGFERERQNQPAGWRTHIILVVGSTLAMTLSINLAIEFQPLAPNGDPARLAAQVLAGIGFLCAGAIFRLGLNVKGLTTAASMWTMAIVGLAVGAGMFKASIAVTAIVLAVLELLDLVEKRLFGANVPLTLTLQATDRPGLLKDLTKFWKKHHMDVHVQTMEKDVKQKRVTIEFGFLTRKVDLFELISIGLEQIEGVESYKIT